MTVNPVFINELRQSFLRRKPLQSVFIWVGLTGLLIWLTQFAPPNNRVTLLPLFALPLVVPAFAAGSFAKEYEQQTWQDLYLTRLTNLQVVLGKFGAALLLSMVMMLCFVPAMILLEINHHNYLTFEPGWWMVILLCKLLMSASHYVMLAMTCSRYSPNRRTAMVWCYVALSLYAMMGYMIWNIVGYQAEVNTAILNAGGGTASIDELAAPGFMGGIHLLFCSVVGLGTMVLLWVSLSEQRGYKVGAGEEDKRAWQPTARRRAIGRI
jgi:hypothetical protein